MSKIIDNDNNANRFKPYSSNERNWWWDLDKAVIWGHETYATSHYTRYNRVPMKPENPEFPVVTRESRCNSRKSTWFPRHRKMKPFPATVSQEKSHVRYWRSKRYLAPLMRPTKCPDIPVSLEIKLKIRKTKSPIKKWQKT